jgi:hypothetical protein
MSFGRESHFTLEQLDELRTLVNEVDWTPGTGSSLPRDVLGHDWAPPSAGPPAGSFLHRLALEF